MQCCDNNTLCVFGVFLAFVAVFINLLFSLFVTVHRKINFLVSLYSDSKYSDTEAIFVNIESDFLLVI